ncbi:hypothetical protein Lal_00046904 [Lupinus albus]|nr:hypothetical protein Lal_00046904 [Lupinus albus]
MKAILGYQEVSELVEDGFQEFPANLTEAQMLAYKENKKKYYNIERIAGAATSQEAWESWRSVVNELHNSIRSDCRP